MTLSATLELTELDLVDASDWHVVALRPDRSEHGVRHPVPAPPFFNVQITIAGQEPETPIPALRVLRDGHPVRDIPITGIHIKPGDTLIVTLSLAVAP